MPNLNVDMRFLTKILIYLIFNYSLANWNARKNMAYLNNILAIGTNSARGRGGTYYVGVGKLARDKFLSLATASLFAN